MARSQRQPGGGRSLVALSALALAVSPISAALLAPILARLLGADGRGQLSAILAPLTLADAIATVGLPAAITYYRAKGLSTRSLLRMAAPLATITSLATYGVLAGYALVVGRQQDIDPGLLQGVWLFVIVGLVLGIFRAIRMGEQAWLSVNLERVAAPLLRLLACSALILTGEVGVQAVAIVYLVSGLLGSAFLWIRSWALEASPQQPPSRRDLYGYGFRSWFTSLSYTVNTRVDQVVLAGLVAPAQLGHYAIAVTIAELPSVVYKAANRILFSRTAAGGSWSSAARMNRAITWCSLLAAGGLAALCPVVVPVIFGAEFVESVLLTQILLIGTVFAASSSILGAAIAGNGRPGSVSLTEAIGVAVTVAGLVISAPLIGVLGASLTVTMTQLVILGSRAVVFKRQSGIGVRGMFLLRYSDIEFLFGGSRDA